MIETLKQRAQALKVEAYALWIAYRDRRVPWYAKVWVGLVLAHTFSPIDLIPDFIPVLGYLDDLIITPLGIAIALKMIPPEVMQEARQQARQVMSTGEPHSRLGLFLVLAIWAIVLVGMGLAIARLDL
jgi:uncharacterized membrane protein YkvA (DUF1232 family)